MPKTPLEPWHMGVSPRSRSRVTLQGPGLALPALLSSRSPYDTSQEGYKDWTFMSTHFWDENPKGIWTLRLENKGDNRNTGA